MAIGQLIITGSSPQIVIDCHQLSLITIDYYWLLLVVKMIVFDHFDQYWLSSAHGHAHMCLVTCTYNRPETCVRLFWLSARLEICNWSQLIIDDGQWQSVAVQKHKSFGHWFLVTSWDQLINFYWFSLIPIDYWFHQFIVLGMNNWLLRKIATYFSNKAAYFKTLQQPWK